MKSFGRNGLDGFIRVAIGSRNCMNAKRNAGRMNARRGALRGNTMDLHRPVTRFNGTAPTTNRGYPRGALRAKLRYNRSHASGRRWEPGQSVCTRENRGRDAIGEQRGCR